MIFLLRMNLSEDTDARSQIVEGLMAALDAARHEDAFTTAPNGLSSYSINLHGADSSEIGRMSLVIRDDSDEST